MSENETINAVYTERNKCVALIAALALGRHLPVGIGKDFTQEKEWQNVIYVELPTEIYGETRQVSWHIHESEMSFFAGLPTYNRAWDGHTTDEKYERVLNCVQGMIAYHGKRGALR